MNSLVRKFMFVGFMSVLIVNMTPAQIKSQPDKSQPSQVGLAKSVLEARPVESMWAAPYDEMMDDYQHNMMIGMEPYNRSRSMTGRKVFIVPTAEIEIEDYVAIEKDMEVMSLIFDRALRKPQMIGGVFTVLEDFFGRDSHVTEAIYLEGYGVLFFMEVKFPLFGPSESKQEEAPKEGEGHVDEIWKRAEQELYSPQELNRDRSSDSNREYDAEKVESLKSTLITVLKHAANIKALKSDEFVVLTIFGRAPRPVRSISPYGRSFDTTKNLRAKAIPVGTVVDIRAKKADIDAYSKGEHDFEGFKERIQIFTHYK
jgi:hypothetical protein